MGSTKKTDKPKDSGKTVVKNIIDNYKQLEQSIVSQLMLCNDLHPGTTGSLREDNWLQIFEMIVPKKFVIEHSIFIIDSYHNVSKEVDLAIIDNNYTPYIFQFGRLKYVPIEAVAAVIECKSTSLTFQEEDQKSGKKESGMTAWCNSIEKLRTSRESITRMASGTIVEGKTYGPNSNALVTSTQTSTRPIRIFCGCKTELGEDSEKKKKIHDFFDFVLLASEKEGESKINITASQKSDSLHQWYKELDHYHYEEESKQVNWGKEQPLVMIENQVLDRFCLSDFSIERDGEDIPLLSFNFQLNQLLMLINNPMLFPHLAYVKMFNQESREKTC